MDTLEQENLLQTEDKISDELNAEELEAVAGGGLLGAIGGAVLGGAAGFITTGNVDGIRSGAAAGAMVGAFLPEP